MAATAFALLEAKADVYPEEPAVRCGLTAMLSFADLHQRALRLAGGLATRCGPGAWVMIAAKNCPEYVEAMFAAWAAGQVIVPVNARLHPREIAEIAEDFDPALNLASAAIGKDLQSAMPAAPILVLGEADYAALCNHPPIKPHPAGPRDLAGLFYTSGTAGRSKGAMLTHANLVAMASAHLANIDHPPVGSALPHAAPMSNGSGLYILPYLAAGAAQVIPQKRPF